MIDYIKEMIEQFPEDLKGKSAVSPSNENLFKVNPRSRKLDQNKAEEFHTAVAKGLFASTRARPDIQPTIAFLCTRVREPTEEDWNKLQRLMKFLNSTQDDVLTLSADGSNVIKWHVDAAFAVHPDFKSHTGAVATMGKGAIKAISKKQKINTRSSTEAELIAADDIIGHVLWTRLFLEAQGYAVKDNVVFQDNQSAILLERNGKASSGKRTRHFNIRYFFLTDQVANNNVTIQFCPTDEMTADFMTKPLQGQKFAKFRKLIMNS
jgi:hypothetical protein